MHRYQKFFFEPQKYPFREIVSDYLAADSLETIEDSELRITCSEESQVTRYHNIFQSKIENDPRLMDLFGRFVREIVQPLLSEEIVYERVPMLRIHHRNNLAVFDFHTDKDYLAAPEFFEVFKHERNFWIPLTDAFDTNTLWIESEVEKGDYAPVNSKYGELSHFDGANLKHGNKINTTNQTRVSLDFRVLPRRLYEIFEKKVTLSEPHIVEELKIYYRID